MYNTTTGSYSSALGSGSLYTNTIGGSNNAFGYHALYKSVGIDNVAVGTFAMENGSSGSENTAIGTGTLSQQITSGSNVALGYRAGYGDGTTNRQTTVDNEMTFLGTYASRDASVSTATPIINGTAIGYNATVGCSNCIVLGTNGVKVGIGKPTPTTALDVVGGITSTGNLELQASGQIEFGNGNTRINDGGSAAGTVALIFSVYNFPAGSVLERARINEAGHFGIGYATGTEITNNTLAVNGQSQSLGVLITPSDTTGLGIVANEGLMKYKSSDHHLYLFTIVATLHIWVLVK